ncbi:MAG: SDR family oxidoreductase [Ruminococcaceae bacterium]|nr:SDR family oxidoreductase [Oscillospiraceae bacterium]
MSRIVLITGASSGYGKATAKAFKDNGDIVIMTARNGGNLEQAKKEVGGDLAFSMDVTNPADWENAVKIVKEKYGRLDILVNNAGGGIAIKEVREFTTEEIDSTIKLNLNSVIYGCRAFALMMKEQKSGTMINISSVCARQCWPTWSVYAAAKAGVLNFSKGMYLEMQPHNVRVTCVVPGSASTGFQSACGIGETTDKLLPEDIANTVLYIANLPQRAVVEDVTVWGIDKQVNPL